MSVVTRTLTVNAAFLQEIKQDNRELRELFQQTERALSNGESGAKQIAELLQRLQDQIAMHFALEQAFGYFEDALSVEPRLSECANDLQAEHAELFAGICELVEEAEQRLYREPHARATRQIAAEFAEFSHRFQDHEDRENELILQAMDDDIGVGD